MKFLTKIILLVLLLPSTYLFSELRFVVEDFEEVSTFEGYKTFDANKNGDVALITNDGTIDQIYLFINGEKTQITSNSLEKYQSYSYLSINNNKQIVWVQTDYDESLSLVNYNVYTASPSLEPTRINNLISENNNICAYPSINDNGQIVWQQYGEGTDTDIFIYSYGEVTEITPSNKEENFPKINNNGYVVFEGWDPPEGNYKSDIYLWDGYETRIIATKDAFNCSLPIIDNDNNVIFQTYDEATQNEGPVYEMYSIDDNQKYPIDQPISGGLPLGSMSTLWIENSKIIFTGIDNNIYLFDKVSLTKLTESGVNSSPFIIGNKMAWVVTDESKGYDNAIVLRFGDNEYVIQDAKAWTALKIFESGKIIYSKGSLSTFPLATAELLDVFDVNGIIYDVTTSIKKDNPHIQADKGLQDVLVSSGKRSATTDIDGKFILKNLIKGNHKINFFKEEYYFAPASIDIIVSDEDITLPNIIKGSKTPIGVFEENSQLIRLFPNPTTDYIELNLNEFSMSSGWNPSKINIYNSLGERMSIPSPILNNENGVRIDVSNFSPGVYLVRIGKEIEKFVKI